MFDRLRDHPGPEARARGACVQYQSLGTRCGRFGGTMTSEGEKQAAGGSEQCSLLGQEGSARQQKPPGAHGGGGVGSPRVRRAFFKPQVTLLRPSDTASAPGPGSGRGRWLPCAQWGPSERYRSRPGWPGLGWRPHWGRRLLPGLAGQRPPPERRDSSAAVWPVGIRTDERPLEFPGRQRRSGRGVWRTNGRVWDCGTCPSSGQALSWGGSPGPLPTARLLQTDRQAPGRPGPGQPHGTASGASTRGGRAGRQTGQGRSRAGPWTGGRGRATRGAGGTATHPLPVPAG